MLVPPPFPFRSLKSAAWLGWAQTLGLGAGLVLALAVRGEASPRTMFFRLGFFPLAGALAAWAAALAWGARRAGAGWARGQLRAWAERLGRRWPLWLLILALAGGAWLMGLQAAASQRELVALVARNLEPGEARGWRGWWDPVAERTLARRLNWFPDWTTRPKDTAVLPRLALDSRRDPEFAGHFFKARFVGLLRLDRERRVRLGTESDDGSLLLVDGRRLVANLGIHPPRRMEAEVSLAAGDHVLEILFSQDEGGAFLRALLPADLADRLRPPGPGLDCRATWLPSRQVEWGRNREGALSVAALLLAYLGLLPGLATWPGRLGRWLAAHLPHLAILVATGAVLGFELGHFPGLDGDEAHFGITAFEWHWSAPVLYEWSEHAGQKLMIWPIYLLQQLFPLSVGLMRASGVLLNLGGLFLVGLAAERTLGRRHSLLAMALLGASGWYLFFARNYVELHALAVFCAGLGFFGAAHARRWWGGPLAAAGLALGLQAHGLFAVHVIGFGLGLLAALGPRLGRERGFWLGLGCFLPLAGQWLWLYCTGRMPHASSDYGLVNLLAGAQASLSRVIPHLLDGSYLALYATGELRLALPFLAPLALVGLLALWPWSGADPRERRVLRLLGALSLAAWLVTVLKVPSEGLELRYFAPTLLPLTLLAGSLAAVLWGRGGWRRVAGGTLFGLLGGAGALAYLVGCHWAFDQTGGRSAEIPGIVFAADRKMDKRALYLAVADQPLLVSYPYWDRRSLDFHEREDLTGRRGLRASEQYEDPSLVVEIRGNANFTGIKPGGRPVSLGPWLDRNFQAYVWGAPSAEPPPGR